MPGSIVLGLHQGYLRTARAAGLVVSASWPVVSIARHSATFEVRSADGTTVEAAHVVDAAGAWADVVAEVAGARPLGLTPLRRTLAVCPTKVETDPHGPLVSDADHGYYWKPEGPNVLVSPADETPSEPCDARPEELDVALGIERVNESTTLGLRSVSSAWAGLRTFAPDRVPVIGADPELAGFWWLAGQGGYGIQTKLLRRLSSSLACDRPGDPRGADLQRRRPRRACSVPLSPLTPLRPPPHPAMGTSLRKVWTPPSS
ncbi:MAG: FAD-binding oxidoreductase [Ilumatobacteraceae bacterium]